MPVGTVLYFAANIPPDGFLECDGSILSSSTYPALVTLLGSTYGSYGKLPDLRGEFIRGVDHGRGIDFGRILGSIQADSIQAFKIVPTKKSTGLTANYFDVSWGPRVGGGGIECLTMHPTGDNATHHLTPVALDNTTTIRQSNETRGHNIALLPCIKY